MRFLVGLVVVLVAPKTVWIGLIAALCDAVITIRMVGFYVGRAHVHFCPHGAQDVNLLLRLLVAHGANQLVTFDRTRQSKSHSCIPTGALNHGASRLQQSISLGIFYHSKGHAIFDAVTRIEVFDLGIYWTRKILGHVLHLDHGRIPNGRQDVLMNVFSSLHRGQR